MFVLTPQDSSPRAAADVPGYRHASCTLLLRNVLHYAPSMLSHKEGRQPLQPSRYNIHLPYAQTHHVTYHKYHWGLTTGACAQKKALVLYCRNRPVVTSGLKHWMACIHQGNLPACERLMTVEHRRPALRAGQDRTRCAALIPMHSTLACMPPRRHTCTASCASLSKQRQPRTSVCRRRPCLPVNRFPDQHPGGTNGDAQHAAGAVRPASPPTAAAAAAATPPPPLRAAATAAAAAAGALCAAGATAAAAACGTTAASPGCATYCTHGSCLWYGTWRRAACCCAMPSRRSSASSSAKRCASSCGHRNITQGRRAVL